MSKIGELPGVTFVLGRVLSRALPSMRAQRRLLVGSSLALAGHMVLRLIEPWPLKFVFDLVAGGPTALALPGGVVLDGSGLLLACALAIPAIAGLGALAAYYNTVGFALVGNRVLTDLRAELYRHLQALSPGFHSREKSGDLIVRVVGDIGLLKEVAVTAFLPLVAHTLVLVAMLGVMLWLHWGLTLAAVSVAPAFWLVSMRQNRRIHAASRKQRQREGQIAATAAESIAAVSVVQSLSLEGAFSRTFEAANEQGFSEGVQGRRLTAQLERSVDVLVAVASGLVIFYGASLVLSRVLSPGDLLVFITYLRRAFRPVKDFAKYSARLSRAAAAGERVLSVLDQEPEVQDAPDATPAPAFRGAVRFVDVDFSHDPETPVLRGISFDVEAGTSLAIVGPAGAGKSTLLGLLLRLHDPDAGRVEVDGVDIRRYTLASLRAQTGIVLQDTILFSGTVGENIALGREGASASDVEAAVQRLGCEAFIAGLPQAYDTEVGERGVTLSSGQRQLIALCRMAIRDVPILILDEPTSALDRGTARSVNAAMTRLVEGRTTIVVTHDLGRAAKAARIVLMDEGRVVRVGTHHELLETDSWYADLSRPGPDEQASKETSRAVGR